jgi:hypothetical protein
LLDARVYLYPTAEVKRALANARDAENSETISKIANALGAVGVVLPGDLLKEISTPTRLTLEVMSETLPLLNNRRMVSNLIDKPAEFFKIDTIDVRPLVNFRSNHNVIPCGVSGLSSPADDESPELALRFGYDEQNKCVKETVLLPVSGRFVAVPQTSFREWLEIRHLFKPPLFRAGKEW